MSLINQEYASDFKGVSRALKTLKPYETGWDLCRLGGEEDGAYLVPNCIGGIERCFSAGVCNFVAFENDLARVFAVPSSTCDPEDTGLPTGSHRLITFGQFKLSSQNSEGELTLDEWVNRESDPHEASLMLSMDIEGSEYEVIMNCTDETLNAFRIITLEMHCLHMIWENRFRDYFLGMIKKLTRFHDIVHMHPNNGTVYRVSNVEVDFYTCVELTLLHKSYRKQPPVLKQIIRHSLDITNVTSKPRARYEFVDDAPWSMNDM